MSSGLKLLSPYAPLAPSIMGLCFARSGLIVAGYGSYTRTDDGIYTDGSMLVVLAVMAVILLAIAVSKARLRKSAINRIMRVCVVLEALCIVAFPVLRLAGTLSPEARYLLCVAVTLFGSFSIFYWLRRARGCGTTTAVTYVFSALAASEVEIYVCSLAGDYGFLVAAAFALLQLPCMLGARKSRLANDIDSFTPSDDFFGFATTVLSSKRFLSATAISIGALSVVIGFLRGYPNGQPIAFQPGTRIAYGLLTIVLCGIFVFLVLKQRRRVMTAGIFVVMELLACVALVLYAAFPDMLDIGAVFTTTLNALMVAFTWYIIIAFMSFGWRDPYYYALAGWIVWLGCRAVARVLLMNVQLLSMNDVLINAVMSACVVVSAQVALGQFLGVSRIEAEERHELHVQRMERLEEQLADARASAEKLACLNRQLVDGGGRSTCANAAEEDASRRAGTGHANDAGALLAKGTEGGDAAGGGGGPKKPARGVRFAHLMGLDENESIVDVRRATMHGNAKQMGKQFLLSEREMEVLALYAMGWTQKRVAEELYISPSTAHAHIKRIYAKTGLHSRQEILDFMDQYIS